jgi:hypothetical protein
VAKDVMHLTCMMRRLEQLSWSIVMTRKRGRQKGKERRNPLVTIMVIEQTSTEEEEMVAEVVIEVAEGIGREAMATTRYTKHIISSYTMHIILRIKRIKAILLIKCCIKGIFQTKYTKPLLLLKITHTHNPLPTTMRLNISSIFINSSINTISNTNSSINTQHLMAYLLLHHPHPHLRKPRRNMVRIAIQCTMTIQDHKPP